MKNNWGQSLAVLSFVFVLNAALAWSEEESTTTTTVTTTILEPTTSPLPDQLKDPVASTTTTTLPPEPILNRSRLRSDVTPDQLVYAGKIIPTVYYKPVLKASHFKCEEKDKVVLKGTRDRDLALVCPAVYQRCRMQGSCTLKVDGKVRSFNFFGVVNNRAEFFEYSFKICPFGQGVQSICLDPFYSVAADLSFFQPGDVIYIPALVGLLLPDGDLHDGFFVVRDMGSSIVGPTRFDFFTGTLSWIDRTNPFNLMGLRSEGRRFDFYKVKKGPASRRILRERNFPAIPKSVLPPPIVISD